MGDGQATYSLEELATRTGFTPRQIRYYITRRLVPGSDERGPHARYGEETLRRLLLIARLKETPIPPAGRRPTLAEIRAMIDAEAAPDVSALFENASPRRLLSFHAAPHDEVIPSRMQDRMVRETEPSVFEHRLSSPRVHDRDRGRELLSDVLQGLRSLLAELTAAPPSRPDAGESWRRVRTPDVEIHVRAPSDPARRRRLEGALEALESVLDRRYRDEEE